MILENGKKGFNPEKTCPVGRKFPNHRWDGPGGRESAERLS